MLHAIHDSIIIQQRRPDFKRADAFSAFCTKGSVLVKRQFVAENYQLNVLTGVDLCRLDKTCACVTKYSTCALHLDKIGGLPVLTLPARGLISPAASLISHPICLISHRPDRKTPPNQGSLSSNHRRNVFIIW